MPSFFDRIKFWTRETEPPKGGDDYPEAPRLVPIATPRSLSAPRSWTLEDIRAARDQQIIGRFELPVRLAEAFQTDDALFNARNARVDSQSSLRLRWQAADSRAGRKAVVMCRDQKMVVVPPQVRKSLHGTMSDHGIAVGFIRKEVVDGFFRHTLTEWPLEHVYWLRASRQLMTRTWSAPPTEIIHGDGTWVVFSKTAQLPWTHDAALIPAAMIFASRAYAVRDWSQASGAHGNPKLIGELPQGVRLGQDGLLSPEGQLLLDTLANLNTGEATVGLRPYGSKTEVLVNNDQSWQVFERLVVNRERAAFRVYCGTDAALGAQGGAPGVDIEELFGVANTRIQSDLEALERGYREGVVLPWCAVNGFDPSDAPQLEYEVPDLDAARKAEQEALAIERFTASVKALRDVGVALPQESLDALADILQVQIPVTLAKATDRVVPLPLAPTDLAKVVKVDEARASINLPPIGTDEGETLISEIGKSPTAAEPEPDPNDPNEGSEPADPADTSGQ